MARDGVKRLLADRSDRVRRQAVLSFGRRASARELARVRRFLSDPSARVRAAAAVVLGIRKDRSAVPRLLDRLAAPGSWEKPSVLVALGRIGDPRAVPAVAALADAPLPWLRVCAIHALPRLDPATARRVARAHVADPAWSVRGASAVALGDAGSRADLPRLLRLLDDRHPWPRRGAVYALGRLRLPGVGPRVRAALADRSADVRLAAVWALGEIGDRKALRPLARLLGRIRPPTSRTTPTIAPAGQLATDAEDRLFDATLLALRRVAPGRDDPVVARALARARARLPPSLRTREARPAFPSLAVGAAPWTLGALLGEE